MNDKKSIESLAMEIYNKLASTRNNKVSCLINGVAHGDINEIDREMGLVFEDDVSVSVEGKDVRFNREILDSLFKCDFCLEAYPKTDGTVHVGLSFFK